MARVAELSIEGYRSIKGCIKIRFPQNAPLILVGENNAGKTNILRALDLILGEYWPGSKEPEDHEFWQRDALQGKIEITVTFDGMVGDAGTPLQSFVWTYNPKASKRCAFTGKSKQGHPINYVRNEWRDQCICVWVSADRRLSYHLGYSSKWTLLSKLMHKFHSSLIQDSSRVDRLKAKFHEIEEIFQEVEEFSSFQTGLAQQFGEMFSGMSYGLNVDFSAYDPSRFFRSLQVVPHENGERRTLEELGTGQEQILALAFAHAYAKAFYGGIVLAIEEPEAHLHPLAQEWLARKIHQMAADGLQIVITTHSPHFVDLMGLEGLVLVRKDDENATQVCQLTSQQLVQHCLNTGSHRQKTNPDTILPFYANQSTQEILNGFFAKKIILVEGQTEQLALPVYFQKVVLDVTREGIEIVPVIGKGNLAKWWRLFTAYGIPVYVIFDNDCQDDNTGIKRKDALRALGVDEHNRDNYLETDQWLITPKFSVFGKDFETTMRAQFKEYSQLEQEAKDLLGDSKPIVARYVATKLSAQNGDAGWKKWQELKDAILNLDLSN
ncbi:MAG TPA: AAA family ATPase [Anaerolineae bacterium]|nr:AAA family ATPase [Anaerolineae bacterium]HQK12702.1 AAA family ATPase [Anaerolineae bacterium]